MGSQITIRPATPADVPKIFNLIEALAEYEKLSHLVAGNPEDLCEHLFGERIYAEAILAESDKEVAGFALFFCNYSTFLTKPGIYLEDLFVLPEYRRQGIGQAILIYLARLSLERGMKRLEWSVLDWNESAIAFYEKMGAELLQEWRICRASETALSALARLSEDGKK